MIRRTALSCALAASLILLGTLGIAFMRHGVDSHMGCPFSLAGGTQCTQGVDVLAYIAAHTSALTTLLVAAGVAILFIAVIVALLAARAIPGGAIPRFLRHLYSFSFVPVPHGVLALRRWLVLRERFAPAL